VAAQEALLRAEGCAKVFSEKISGKATDGRPELAKLLRRLGEGDVLMVTRLDRLARSTRDLLNILHDLGQRGIGFKSLKDPWCDTTTPHGRLMLTVLGGIAEFERELITARTSEGRTRAKARGVRFGRPLLSPLISSGRRLSGFAEAKRRPIWRGPIMWESPLSIGWRRQALSQTASRQANGWQYWPFGGPAGAA
jgi:DNA invertase Pin-like site-specific DNA recombinase